jgi:hypothetical protein
MFLPNHPNPFCPLVEMEIPNRQIGFIHWGKKEILQRWRNGLTALIAFVCAVVILF